MAHLKTKATTGDMEQRWQWKCRLVRGLYERGYNKEGVLELFRLVDSMMTLPEELQVEFTEVVVILVALGIKKPDFFKKPGF
ncbi:MAG: hypothetical protein SXA11_02565 [Cyanobacteriota bacterium]|nr:hypothetical protein [Cyanobacteriota bacterium]